MAEAMLLRGHPAPSQRGRALAALTEALEPLLPKEEEAMGLPMPAWLLLAAAQPVLVYALRHRVVPAGQPPCVTVLLLCNGATGLPVTMLQAAAAAVNAAGGPLQYHVHELAAVREGLRQEQPYYALHVQPCNLLYERSGSRPPPQLRSQRLRHIKCRLKALAMQGLQRAEALCRQAAAMHPVRHAGIMLFLMRRSIRHVFYTLLQCYGPPADGDPTAMDLRALLHAAMPVVPQLCRLMDAAQPELEELMSYLMTGRARQEERAALRQALLTHTRYLLVLARQVAGEWGR